MAIMKDVYEVGGEEVSILIEVENESLQESPYEDVRGGKDKILSFTKDRLGDALALTQNCASRVVESLKAMSTDIRPDEFEVQFSIKLDSALGAVITQTTMGGQLQVKMKWTKKA